MAYDKTSFLAGVAVGRNMDSWPAVDGVAGAFRFTIDLQQSLNYTTPHIVFNGYIFWGDGTNTWVNADLRPYTGYDETVRFMIPHTYAAYGIYHITMVGDLRDWASQPWHGGATVYNNTLISIDTPFPETMKDRRIYNSALRGAQKLVKIHPKLFELVDVTQAAWLCRECTALTEIPETLFYSCEGVETFARAFYNLPGITSAVPQLWKFFPEANGSGCYAGCINAANWASIPPSWR